MKKLRLLALLAIFFMAAHLTAQEMPQAINFQAVARDANGQALANTNIMLRLTILDETPDGPSIYREIRALPTNAYGGFNFQIGRDPNVVEGVFSDIDWANGRKFLKIDFDPTSTMSFDLSLGTIEFVSVPYAFVAGGVPFIDAIGANDGDVLTFNAGTGRFEPQAAEETDPTVPAWAKEPQKPTYDYSEILNTPEIPEVPTNVSAFVNDANYLTEETDPTIPAWAKEETKPVYSYSEIQNTPDLSGYLTTEVQTIADVAALGNSVNTQLKNVTNPTDAQDAATKAYVDLLKEMITQMETTLNELLDILSDNGIDFPLEGNVNGTFSINGSTKVYFSNGNLQYKASTNTWRFAENQWDYIGSGNNNISPTYDGWIDLFCWGTGNNPTNSSEDDGEYSVFTDWGSNHISNGGLKANMWRTLTKDEWDYILNSRSGMRFAKAKVNGVGGLLILPDEWDASYSLSNVNNGSSSYSSNNISLDAWTTNLEPKGVVFLPAAGWRKGTSGGSYNSFGQYWTSTPDSSKRRRVYFHDTYLNIHSTDPNMGQSVRLVHVIQ